jgi:hypothetical protein
MTADLPRTPVQQCYPILITFEDQKRLMQHLKTIEDLIPWSLPQGGEINEALQKFYNIWIDIQAKQAGEQ